MSRWAAVCCAVVVGVHIRGAHAVTIEWTGIVGDGQWGTPNNWHPARVPTVNDSVVINGAEGKDAVVTLVKDTAVASLVVGKASSSVHVRQLARLTVTETTEVGDSGLFELNSDAAVLTTPTATVSGELQLVCGTLTGSYTITGYANLGGAPAKTLKHATLRISSSQKVVVGGSLQFAGGSTVVATSAIASRDGTLAMRVTDKSTGNSFTADGFEWAPKKI